MEDGYDAVRIAGSGELPPAGNGPVEAIDEDKLGALGRATLRTVTALDRGARARARAGQLRDRGQPGDGGLGAVAAGGHAAAARAGGGRRRVRPRAPPAGGRAALAALGRRRGWRRSWPGSRSPSCWRWSARRLRLRPRRSRPTCCRSTAPRWGCWRAWVWRWRSRCCWRASWPRGPTRGCAGPRRPAPRWRSRWCRPWRRCVLWLANPYAGAAGRPGRPPVAARAGRRRPAAPARPRAAGRARRAAGAARGALLHGGAVDGPAQRRVVPAAARDRASVGLLTALVGCVMLGALCASIELVYRSPAEQPRDAGGDRPATLGPGFAAPQVVQHGWAARCARDGR